ncbi:MAG: PQQ-binding-like beta-propeller repeat protein, partial [Acidobacteriota bacterium]|nr:PQQ-binding-like beta-propeller repeat protein [Acidobacteriota bacterium]
MVQRHAIRFLALAAIALAATTLRADDRALASGQWPHYSGDNGARKYSPLDRIRRDNVAGLRIAWRRPQLDTSLLAGKPAPQLSNNFRSTPIMVNGVMYASNGVGLAEAFDPGSGKTIWVQDPGADGLRGTSNRGVAYWGEGAEARIITFRNRYLYALDPKTGKPIAGFGKDGAVDLHEGLGPLSRGYRWNSAPLVARDVIVMGSAMVDQDSATKVEGDPGDVRAYDVRTGQLRWTFHVVPQEGDPALKTWKGDSWRYTGAGNVWSLMSADDELGYVYLPTTSMTNDMYGGHRLGDTLYATSIVCVDAATGKKVWHYQTVHHDLFDYDNPAAPILVDITVDGKRIKAVAQVTKQSFTYVLDRVTGKPVWPIEERPVPASTVPGEQASPTQPFPTRPPAFDRQGITENDLIDFTPELRAEAEAILENYTYGPLFTAPTETIEGGHRGTIILPGAGGGANWSGAGVDPETGILYVPSSDSPNAPLITTLESNESNFNYLRLSNQAVRGPRGL